MRWPGMEMALMAEAILKRVGADIVEIVGVDSPGVRSRERLKREAEGYGETSEQQEGRDLRGDTKKRGRLGRRDATRGG